VTLGFLRLDMHMEQLDKFGQSTTLIHWMTETSNGLRIACMPNATEFHATPYHPAFQRTDDVRAASCPACRRTAEYKCVVERLEAALRGPASVK